MGSPRTWTIALCIAGLVVSGYLAYSYLSHTPVVCTGGIFSGCVDVQKSPYAQLWGIPLPLYGIGFYAFLLADALFLRKLHARYAWRSFVWFSTLFGFLFSLYLAFLEAFVIDAWCVWCVASGIIATLLFVIATRTFFTRHTPNHVGSAS